MRKLVLMAVLVGLLAAPVLAQFRPGGGGGMGGGAAVLLANKGVQEELKLTDAQKEKAAEIAKAQRDAFTKARKDKDKDAFAKILKDGEAAIAKFKDELKPEQKKRLNQIEVQQAGLRAFQREDVQKDLKLSDKQKDEIKEVAEAIGKDIQELQKDGFKIKDKEKREENQKKLAKLRKEGMDKVQKILNTDQQKAWTELTGTPFELKFDFPGRPGGGKEKGKKDA